LGIKRLSAFDTREHALASLLGRGYQSSTLTQFLGHLERVGADQALLATLVPQAPGQITSVDGHMIASWSRVPMHQGTITMLGRIMAGSQAVVAHDESGQAVFVASYAPDMHLSQVIVAYCHQVAVVTGSRVFVIDRAVNSVALARAFDEQGFGLLCMLDEDEHQGRASFEATQIDPLADGTKVFGGPWREVRQEAPRTFVIVEPPAGKTLVYWPPPGRVGLGGEHLATGVPRAHGETGKQLQAYDRPRGTPYQRWPKEDAWPRSTSTACQPQTPRGS
jgi:hypothetical protein